METSMTRLSLACTVPLLLAATLAFRAGAEPTLFEATFSLKNFGTPDPVGTATGVATVNGSGGGAHLSTLALPGGLVTIQSTILPTTTTTTPPFSQVIVSMTPGAGSFTGGAGTGVIGGVLPVPGNVRVCLFLACAFFVDVPFTQNGTRGVGIGGTIMAPLPATGTITLVGAPWAAATATINGTAGPVTSPGFAHGPASLTSSTAQPSGVLQLVTPVQVVFSGVGPPLVLPVFGTLNVHFLPEPGWFAGLSAGAALVAGLGWRRRHSSRASPRRSAGT